MSFNRQVILGDITGLYEKTVRQVQEVMKPHIVPAILDHDEMARGKSQGNAHINALQSIKKRNQNFHKIQVHAVDQYR